MTRSSIIVVGVVVALLGAAGLVFQRVPYQEDAATIDLGSVEATAALQKEERIPSWLAGGLLVLGIGVLGYGLVRG